MRTNIDIDDELMREAMIATNTATKKAAVEASLRQAIQIKRQERIRKLFGTIVWCGPEDDWFASDEEILEKRYGAEEAARLIEAMRRKSAETTSISAEQPR